MQNPDVTFCNCFENMTLQEFNALLPEDAHVGLLACCRSEKWANAMVEHRPFATESELVAVAESIWYNTCTEADWLDAFGGHPKIGDLASLTQKFADTQHLAGVEQAGVLSAGASVLQGLADGNQAYEAAQGFIFIVCATGKPAHEMLQILQGRLRHTRHEEVRIAMGEQHKISLIRLQKWLTAANWSKLNVSQLTTHVLDTSIGETGKNITIRLQDLQPNGQWETFALGITNQDGRIPDLLPPDRILPAGAYRLVFEVEAYYRREQISTFYPAVEISFYIRDAAHYHVPLLINPYGYSTYRGS